MIYSTIVTGTDGSTTAGRAVREAAELARVHNARLVVVTAFVSQSADGMARLAGTPAVAVATRQSRAPSDVAWALTDRGQAESLARAARNIALELGAPRVSVASDEGDPAHVLLSTVEMFNAELVVVGSVGLSGARRLLGSVAEAVLHHAPCDVLVVQTNR